MALIDDLRSIAALQDKQIKLRHVASALWIFERNPFLPDEEIAQGLAFMVEDYLQEADVHIRQQYGETLARLLESRQELGTAIDWQALVQQLPEVSPHEVTSIIKMLSYAPDIQYLNILERYIHIATTSHHAAISWNRLTLRVLYERDWEVAPLLWNMAQTQQWSNALPQMVPYTPRTRAEAEQHHKEGLDYFPNYIRYWLQPLGPTNPLKEKATLKYVFEYDMTLPIDEIALAVKIMVDHALAHNDPHRNSPLWSGLYYPFHFRRYVGTYLDWDTLLPRIEQLKHLYPERKNIPLSEAITLYGYANNEQALSQLEGYLEHPSPSISLTAAQATVFLLFQLCHYCPFLTFLYAEADQTLSGLKSAHVSAHTHPPSLQQEMRRIIDSFRVRAQPYLHYYSI